MKALDVIPLLTPEVVDRIEAVVQSKPKRTESYRWSGTVCTERMAGRDSAFIWWSLGRTTSPSVLISRDYACMHAFVYSGCPVVGAVVLETFPMWTNWWSQTAACAVLCVLCSAFPHSILATWCSAWTVLCNAVACEQRNVSRISLVVLQDFWSVIDHQVYQWKLC